MQTLPNITKIFNETVVSIGLASITLAGAYATFYLKKLSDKVKFETEKLKDDRKKELVIEALYRLDEVAGKTVSALEQTTAKAIRESLITDSDERKKQFKEVFSDAYWQVINTLEPEYKKVLEQNLGDFKTYVTNVIEDKVREIKEQKYIRS